MHLGEVTSMFVRGPSTWLWSSFKKFNGYLSYERDNDSGSICKGGQYGLGVLHNYFLPVFVNLEAITFAAVAASPQAPLIVGARGLATSPMANTDVIDVSLSWLVLM